MRGVIKNREYAMRVRDYSQLRWGNVTPTDIDGFLEFNNKLFVFIEMKYSDNDLPFGQKLALERLADAVHTPQRCVVIVASYNGEGDIKAHEADVVEYRWKGKWHQGKGKLKPFIDYLVKKYA